MARKVQRNEKRRKKLMALYLKVPLGHEHAVDIQTLAHLFETSERMALMTCERMHPLCMTICNLADGKGYFRPETCQEFYAYRKIRKAYKDTHSRLFYHIDKNYKNFCATR